MNLLFILLSVINFSENKAVCGQGIKGKVVWVSGNQMPGPGRKATEATGIKREILIYEPTLMNEAVRNGSLYSEIRTKIVTQTTSKEDGSFRIKLPPGEYSVFIRENEGYFANLFDGKGRINIIEVKRGQFSEVTIRVDYQAAY